MYIGEESFVAGNTVLRADEGRTVEIGSATNAQDNVTLKALRSQTVVYNETRSRTTDDSVLGTAMLPQDHLLRGGELVAW